MRCEGAGFQPGAAGWWCRTVGELSGYNLELIGQSSKFVVDLQSSVTKTMGLMHRNGRAASLSLINLIQPGRAAFSPPWIDEVHRGSSHFLDEQPPGVFLGIFLLADLPGEIASPKEGPIG